MTGTINKLGTVPDSAMNRHFFRRQSYIMHVVLKDSINPELFEVVVNVEVAFVIRGDTSREYSNRGK